MIYQKSASTEPSIYGNTLELVHAVLRLVAARRETVASTRVSDVSLECFGFWCEWYGVATKFIDMSSEAVNLVQNRGGHFFSSCLGRECNPSGW